MTTSMVKTTDPAGTAGAVLLSAIHDRYDVIRHAHSELAVLAAELVDLSRPSLGAQGLATLLGESNPAGVIATYGQVSLKEAADLCTVGEATTTHTGMTGQDLPARYPILGAAFTAGTIPLGSAHHIVTALDRATPRADLENLVAAETALTVFATEFPVDLVRKLANLWRDALDVDGIEPREEHLIAQRCLSRRVLPNGMQRTTLDTDPLASATINVWIDSYLGTVMRTPRFEPANDPTPSPGDLPDDLLSDLPDPRTRAQIAADAVIDLFQHGISCTNTEAPMPHTTVIVRMTLESLRSGLGAAHIDGNDGTGEPISASTARRLAANAYLIPEVLGGNSEILDWGSKRRLFSPAQRLALAERDGGCAVTGCSKPSTFAEAHHIRWWDAHHGPTDLSNGVLLCGKHHHIIHHGGWTVTVADNIPYFTPPSTVDPYRRPRRGGKLCPPNLPHQQPKPDVWNIPGHSTH